MSETAKSYEGWSIIELMGHRRIGGKVCQAEQYGTAMLRVDIPSPAVIEGDDETWATQFYGGSSIYCLTPTTEAIARAVALRNQPAPVYQWELPAPKTESAGIIVHDDDDGLTDDEVDKQDEF